jgi:antibiotic biosynthesis monooxygenase (ABM) superfamily enzyme
MMNPTVEPVTVVIAQQVKPGQTANYEAWMNQITQVASSYPGYLGAQIIRPQAGVRSEYVVIFRFDHYEHLKAWMTSRDRQNWIDLAQPLLAGPPQIQEITGLEAWFSLPGQATLPPPPRYKMALLTWLAVYLVINLLSRLVAPLLQPLPAWLGSLILCGMTVALLTYAVMPQLTRWFRRWLYPAA